MDNPPVDKKKPEKKKKFDFKQYIADLKERFKYKCIIRFD
jgi:hypothetical protein